MNSNVRGRSASVELEGISMDRLSDASVEWAITHIRRFGDTDIFPVPFEYEAIRHSWNALKQEICAIDLETYEVRAAKRLLVPKQHGGYRVAIRLDPIDTIIYTALAYECAEQVEQFRIPTGRRVSCSYRVEIGARGELFRNKNGWDDFHARSQELSEQFDYVVTADIADFYNQIGHHRVRNALEVAGVSSERAKNIENLLMNFTGGQSQGLPIGPSASVIFSEACLNDVDNYLLRKGYEHTRYVDDFRVFCNTPSDANKIIHDLTEYLYTAHRLSLQSHKTRILPTASFRAQELLDPEELEEKTKEERLEAIASLLSGYGEPNEEATPDLAQVARDNLLDLFSSNLELEHPHLGLAKYLLRRATTLKTGVIRDVVLANIEKLTPAMREVCLYLIATTKDPWSAEIGRQFLAGINRSDQSFLPYIGEWVIEVLLACMARTLEPETRALCESSRHVLGVRPYALLSLKNGYVDWVREQKEIWQNNQPWDRRAVIWASQALSADEIGHWLPRVQGAGDVLDKAIAGAALHVKNGARAP